ncbi:MAG: competence/damage-inducible protein A [Flammeovirgaceae bacterium]
MNQVFAEVLTIGDEILYGQITDTNSQWIGEELSKIGVNIIRKTSVGDDKVQILKALQEAESRASIILTTGGLGPTKDDITKNTFAEYFGVGMTMRNEVLENIKELFRQRGRELTQLNEMQALVPENAEVIMNLVGTAPGMWFMKNGKVFVSMPGVPHEMKKMMTDTILPKIQKTFKTPHIYHKSVKTIGIAESKLAKTIEAWEDALPSHIKLAYLPRLGQVRLRLTCIGENLNALQAEAEELVQKLKPLIGEYIFAYEDEEIEVTIGKLLKDRKETLAVAESCTGGMVSNLITNVAGCSTYFVGGIVAYSNDVKISQLGVKKETLDTYGAVSEQTAMEMAEGIRKRLKTTYGIATTGIAGPDGGTPTKPVGTIWIGFSSEKETVAKQLNLTKDRLINIQLTYSAVMNLLRKRILGEEWINNYIPKEKQ